jgi:hypothetical protein
VSPRRATASGRWQAVDTRGPLRRAAAFMAAGAVLASLVGWLLVENHRASTAQRAEVLRQHSVHIWFQAQTVGHALDNAERALRQVGESAEVEGFLGSLDLGMSEQYGLALARGAVRGRLNALVNAGREGGEPLFERVSLLDAKGGELARAAADGDPHATSGARPSGEREGVFLTSDGARIVVVQRIVRE